jgi:hypothetical protein
MEEERINILESEVPVYNAGYQVGFYKGFNHAIKIVLILQTILIIICFVIYKLF